MDLRHLRYFRAVAEASSFSRAAERLRVAQPALSRSVAKLESDLGKALFVRHGAGVTLTEAGAQLCARAETLLAEFEALKLALTRRDDEPQGRLAFGVPSAMRGLLIAPVLARFLKAFPRADLVVTQRTSALLKENMENGLTDIAVMGACAPSSHIHFTPLLTESIFIVGPAERGWRMDQPVALSDFASLPLILTTFPNCLRVELEAAFRAAGATPFVRCEVDNADLMVELVAQGAGCTVLPYSSLHDVVGRFELAAAPVPGLALSWYIAASRTRFDTPAARQLRAMLVREAATRVTAGEWPTAQIDAKPFEFDRSPHFVEAR